MCQEECHEGNTNELKMNESNLSLGQARMYVRTYKMDVSRRSWVKYPCNNLAKQTEDILTFMTGDPFKL